MSDVRCQMSDVRCQMSDVRCQMSDVRCRAGFILGNDKRLYPFVIMVNGENKGYDSIRRDLLRRVNMITKGN